MDYSRDFSRAGSFTSFTEIWLVSPISLSPWLGLKSTQAHAIEILKYFIHSRYL